MKRNLYVLFTLFTMLIICPDRSSAQKLSIGFIYPAGGGQGSSVDVEIGGLNIKDAKSAIISGDGVRCEIIPLPEPEPQYRYVKGADGKQKKIVIPKNKLTDQSAPQIADRVGLRVHIDADAEPGLRNLRLQSIKGVSNQLSFEVSQYPNVMETRSQSQREGAASNKSTSEETTLVESLPATLCGYVKPGEIDRFTFRATKGMELVAEVKGRILVPYIADAVPGWFQPIVKLINSKGEEVAYADDYRTSPDPVLRFSVTKTDYYTLSIHDAIFRGREDFNYRIQLGEIPFVESIYPLVARVGEPNYIDVKGRNLSASRVVVRPEKAGINYLRVEGKGDKLSNQIAYWAVDKEQTMVDKPTVTNPQITDQSTITQIAQDVVIYDKIATPYEQRGYRLPLAEGESVVVDAVARRIDSRADLKITLLAPSGDVVLESDDVEDTAQGLMTHHADPVISYKADQSGLYTIVVEDLLGGSGDDYSYLIRRSKPSAPFDAFVSPANITLSQGGTTTFFVNFDLKGRKDISGVGRIVLDGLPDGYRVSNLIPGRYPKMWEVSVTAPKDASVGRLPISVKVYTAPRKGEEEMVVEARPTDNMMQAFYYTHYIPAESFTLEVIPAIPYTLHFTADVERDLAKPMFFSAADSLFPVKVIVDRRADFDDELDLALGRGGKLVTLAPVKMLAGESEKVVYLKLDREKLSKMKYFRYPLYIVATAGSDIQRQGQRSFTNALYRDMTPLVMLQRDDVPIIDPYRYFKQQAGGQTKR